MSAVDNTGEWSEARRTGERLSIVDRAVAKLGIDVGLASALALGVSTLVWSASSAAVFGHGVGARFPLSLLAAQAALALVGFALGAPFNRGPPTVLSVRLFQASLPAGALHAAAAWGAARVLGSLGVVSLAAARCFAALLTLVLEGIVLHEPVARLVVCSSLLLVLGGVVAAAAERSVAPSGTGASVAASVHALCTAAFFVACRAAPFPPGSSAKARALGVCAVATALLGAGACALELRALLEQPREPMTHLAAPLLLAALATAQWHCAAHWCVGGTSAGTAALTCAYAMLPAIPLATLALRGSHAAASAVAAATSSAGATTTAASAAATAAATGAAAGGGGGGGGEDGGGASPPPSELAQALGLPAGLARRGVVSSAGVLLMAMACGCFSYSKERQRRIEAMLGAADLDDVDEPGETAGLVAALTADSE